jgi:hypothetical protein
MKQTITLLALLLLTISAPAYTPAGAQPASNCRTFSLTGKTVCGDFLTYWDTHGGLAQQGFPISGQFSEVSDVDGKTYTVQYFERAVFELHPENKPPFDVLLSLLGTRQLKQKYPNGAPDTDPTLMPGELVTFPETRKQVSGIFLEYWRNNGGLAQQGYPLTNPLLESPTRTTPAYVVQYFERAVFELHSDSTGKPIVLLSRLGATVFAAKYPNGEPFPTPAPGADAWATLRARPLSIPSISPGSPCPVTPSGHANDNFGIVLGTGPVYPIGFGADGVYHYSPIFEEGGWYFMKVLWIADPSYKGPALVRGLRVDGPGQVRFERGPNPPTELQLAQDTSVGAPGDWPNWPSYTRVQSLGCYAYQVDGTNFSKTIVFRVDK